MQRITTCHLSHKIIIFDYCSLSDPKSYKITSKPMISENMPVKINITYIFILLAAVFVTTLLHELAHWAMGEALGYNMTATLNSTDIVLGNFTKEWHKNSTTAAGPLFTILQAVVCYFIVNKKFCKEWYAFLFFPFVMRFWAGLANLLGPNDEGRLGLTFGIGLLSIPFVVCSFLLFLVYKTSKTHHLSFKFNSLSFLFSSLFLLLLVFINDYFHIKII